MQQYNDHPAVCSLEYSPISPVFQNTHIVVSDRPIYLSVFDIAIVGDHGVGKKTLATAMDQIGVFCLQGKTARLKPWVCGSNSTDADLDSVLRGADGVISLYDLTDTNSLKAAEEWITLVRSHTEHNNPMLMMLGNKSDKDKERKVHFYAAQETSSRLGIRSFDVTQISSKVGHTTKLVKALTELAAVIVADTCPTFMIKADVTGHEVQFEIPQEERRSWYRKMGDAVGHIRQSGNESWRGNPRLNPRLLVSVRRLSM